MTILLSALGALGLVLVVQHLPGIRKVRMRDRVEPYLAGLHGAPSTLISRGATSLDVISRAPLGRSVLRLLPSPSPDLQERLRQADVSLAPIGFRLLQFTWGLVALIASATILLTAARAGLEITPASFGIAVLLAFVLGYLARDWRLTRQIEARRSRLQQELPAAIDLLTLAITAGEPVAGAFERVARQLGEGIGTEFARVVADVRAGTPLIEALEELKLRVPIGGISRFVDALCTGIERGSPLAEVLTGQADDGREARRRLLMEMGGKREILMLLPVVFLIMPVVVVFALLPGLVSLDLLVP